MLRLLGRRDSRQGRVPKKRIRLQRNRQEIVQSASRLLGAADTESPASPEELRERVRLLVNLSQDAKELGLYHVKPMLLHDSGSERILAYLRMFVMRISAVWRGSFKWSAIEL